jgi:hypothetical protein
MFAPLDPKNPTTSELEHMAGHVPLKTQPTYTAPAWWAKLMNPDTHCPTCGEPLSEFGHCWQHPTQAAAPTQAAPYCEGQCGICSCISSPSTPAK